MSQDDKSNSNSNKSWKIFDSYTMPKLSSELLFKQQDKVIIEHLGEEYVLRITRSGKLILTK